MNVVCLVLSVTQTAGAFIQDPVDEEAAFIHRQLHEHLVTLIKLLNVHFYLIK